MDRMRGWFAFANWFRVVWRPAAKDAPPDPSERRRFTRVAVGVPGKIFIASTEGEADCVVTNISPAGAEVACDVAKLLDTRIVLYAAGLGRFEGHVVWERDGSYGVRFQARLAEPPAGRDKAPGSERRRDKRVASNVRAQFMREDGTVVPCVVLDFSISGVSLKTNLRPRLGEHVLIGGMVGKVVRLHEKGVGVEFVSRERDDASFRKSLESLELWQIEEESDEQRGR